MVVHGIAGVGCCGVPPEVGKRTDTGHSCIHLIESLEAQKMQIIILLSSIVINAVLSYFAISYCPGDLDKQMSNL